MAVHLPERCAESTPQKLRQVQQKGPKQAPYSFADPWNEEKGAKPSLVKRRVWRIAITAFLAHVAIHWQAPVELT
jgi:hypothetical protein